MKTKMPHTEKIIADIAARFKADREKRKDDFWKVIKITASPETAKGRLKAERAHWYAKYSEKIKRIIELEKTLELIEHGHYENGDFMDRDAMRSCASHTLAGEK